MNYTLEHASHIVPLGSNKKKAREIYLTSDILLTVAIHHYVEQRSHTLLHGFHEGLILLDESVLAQ